MRKATCHYSHENRIDKKSLSIKIELSRRKNIWRPSRPIKAIIRVKFLKPQFNPQTDTL